MACKADIWPYAKERPLFFVCIIITSIIYMVWIPGTNVVSRRAKDRHACNIQCIHQSDHGKFRILNFDVGPI